MTPLVKDPQKLLLLDSAAPRVPDIVVTASRPATRALITAVEKTARSVMPEPIIVQRSFPLGRNLLDSWHRIASNRLKRPVPHLGRFFRIRVGADTETVVQRYASLLAERVPDLSAVEVSCAPTEADLAELYSKQQRAVCIAPDQLSRREQPYLTASRGGGLGVSHAWRRLGDGPWRVKVCDCEWGFDPQHVDLPEVEVVPPRGGRLDRIAFHGTATLGVIGARRHGLGINGIAHGARLLFSSEAGGYRPQCIGDALLRLRTGDVLVLEMQAVVRWPPDDPDDSKREVPAEYDADIHAVSLTAAGLGITVVAAAGNGDLDLTRVTRSGRFLWDPQDSAADSLAILVGSGDRHERKKVNATNHSRRITCQGWGDGIVAPRDGESPRGRHDCYFDQFNATSAATAMIAGLVACLQAAVKAAGRRVLRPERVRSLLAKPGNGLEQDPLDVGTGWIGPFPDLGRLLPAVKLH